MTTAAELIARVAPVVTELGLDLDDVKISGSGKHRVVEIIVDADEPIDLDRIADVSRAVSEFFDESDVMGSAPYLLEVSTRGIGTPLTKPVHWRRNVGRLVTFTTGTNTASGRIMEFVEPTVVVNVKGQTRSVNISDISRAVIDVEFNRKDDA